MNTSTQSAANLKRNSAMVSGPVSRFVDLPLNDPIGTVRSVNADSKRYRCENYNLDATKQWFEWTP